MQKKREYFRSLKDIPREEFLSCGTGLCAGCAGLLTLRLFHKALGEKAIFINAAGCMTMLAVFPYTPLESSWLYTAMASAPAGAQGVRDALDILLEKGRIPREEDLAVVVLTGDGAAGDIGLQATLAAIHRGLDFYYLCYDNEAYGNTGFQMSPSSPYGSATTTSPAGSRSVLGTEQKKKNLFEIWRSLRPPYLATLSAAHPLDLGEKVKQAAKFKGPKLFIAISPCPPGWSYDERYSADLADLAVATGIWPLKEAVYGEVAHTVVPGRFLPVEEYLSRQGRFRHLFHPVMRKEAIREIQREVDAYWERYPSKAAHQPLAQA
jgi:pyruvate ferredoxin oxidoreductase beta subunit